MILNCDDLISFIQSDIKYNDFVELKTKNTKGFCQKLFLGFKQNLINSALL